MDSDDEYETQPSWRGVPGTIILVNVFGNSTYNNFAITHTAICRLIRQHMRSSSSQYIGVCLYGIEESNDLTINSKSVIEVIPLSLPTLDDFEKLNKTNISTFKEAKELKLSDVLWHCSKMFANCKKQLSSRTVIMLTRLDTPPVVADQTPSLNRARDLVDSNIELKIINISENEYNIDAYFSKMLAIANKSLDYIVPKPIWNSSQIEKLMYQESHRHLAVARLQFEIGSDFNIGVGVFTLLKRPGQNYKKNVDLDQESNSVLTSVTKTLKVTVDAERSDEDESQMKKVPLLRSELLHYQEFGGENIEFTDNEMKTIKNPFGPPMIKLLGFKPADLISKAKWFLKMGYFLFPNESIIEGSTVAFKALHQACTDKKVVAICVLCTRVNSKPSIVALYPCKNPLNLNVDVGFDIIIIPFVESVRDININLENEDEDCSTVEDAHKSIMSDIVNELEVNYVPDMFEDPKLQSKYRVLEAIALCEDDAEPFIDSTKPPPEKFQNIRDDLFEELFGPFNALSLKRAALTASSTAGAKKAKILEINDYIINKKLSENKIADFTVQQLKQILKSKDIKSLPALNGLKKQELVDLVYNHLG